MLPMIEALYNAPVYHLVLEALLVIWVLRLLFRKSHSPKDRVILTEAEKDELIAEWKPEPLVPPVDPMHPALHPRIVTGKAMKTVTVDGRDCLNFSTHNYLGLIGNTDVELAAIKCLEKYGVGSCGPRGFYGTTDVHLDLEDMIAKFMHCEEAVLYSYSFATIASAIPAYAKRGDIIFADMNVNFAIQKGLDASRSNIIFFRHNDMNHLEELLESQAKADLRVGSCQTAKLNCFQHASLFQDPKKAAVTRKFLIVEALYMNSGDICPLPELVELKRKYKLRFFVDECLSIGVLGASGRGVFEFFNMSVNEADLICGSLEYCLGSLGGFCVGSSYVVDHQRLSGLGYCFSASLPPLLAAGAMASFSFLESNAGKEALLHLENICKTAHSLFNELLLDLEQSKHSSPNSPIKHLYAKDHDDPEDFLQSVVKMVEEKAIAIVTATYLEKEEKFCPAPSIRIALASHHVEEDVRHLISVLNEATSALSC
ncbi:unnamed protein product [Notodromas monacha]|uniref:Serine palmitoyltransferase 1 n=1 Tax=Notodromas monacha TaxID=399045 RepID=A0A7R9BRY8_9CRUS|nr:unnamed protein product [Notodromas monacha]CAG0920599.1 unnamed protein product [Notodromas monacha]